MHRPEDYRPLVELPLGDGLAPAQVRAFVRVQAEGSGLSDGDVDRVEQLTGELLAEAERGRARRLVVEEGHEGVRVLVDLTVAAQDPDGADAAEQRRRLLDGLSDGWGRNQGDGATTTWFAVHRSS